MHAHHDSACDCALYSGVKLQYLVLVLMNLGQKHCHEVDTCMVLGLASWPGGHGGPVIRLK